MIVSSTAAGSIRWSNTTRKTGSSGSESSSRLEGLHLDRWRAELPRHGVGQLATGLRDGARRNLHPVFGGHGQPVEQVGIVLEPQGAGADPLPAAGQLGRDGDRNVERVELLDGGQRHHRLVEGDADERGDVHRALGLEAEHFEGTARHVRYRIVGAGREGYIDRLTDKWGPQGLGGTVEVETVAVGPEPFGQSGEDRRHCGVVE